MRIIRILGNIALWAGACLGTVAGGVWIAEQAGWIQPLIVISGSMEPGIGTGDLLFDRPVATESLAVGDVVSIHSELTGNLVTHRIIDIDPQGDMWEIRMQGDANPQEDIDPYVVGDEVLQPALRIPGAGSVVAKLMDPAVALPILLALIALLGLSLLDEPLAARKTDPETDDDEFAAVASRGDGGVAAELRSNADAASTEVTAAATVVGDAADSRHVATTGSLDELDEMLAALGIDIDHLEPVDEHGADVDDLDDLDRVCAAESDTTDDARELVPSR